MRTINQAIAHSCKEYFLDSKKSEKEILNNLEQISINLGEEKTAVFVSKAYRVLKQDTEKLYLSIKNRDLSLCSQYAHKLRGSSNLYASTILATLLLELVENTESIIDDDDQCKLLFCEFELVLKTLKFKRLL